MVQQIRSLRPEDEPALVAFGGSCPDASHTLVWLEGEALRGRLGLSFAGDELSFHLCVRAGRRVQGGLYALLKMGVRAAHLLSPEPLSLLSVYAQGVDPDLLTGLGLVAESPCFRAPLLALAPSFLETFEPGVLGLAAERLVYSRGDLIYRLGERASHLFVVARGSVRLVGLDLDGNPGEVALLGPGDLMGEEVLGDAGFRAQHAVAHSAEVDLVGLGRAELRGRLCHSELDAWLYRALTARLKALSARLLDGDEPEATARLARVLLGAKRHQALTGQGDGFPLPWLSEQAGVTPARARTLLRRLWAYVGQRKDDILLHDREGLEGWLREHLSQASS